MFRLTYSSLEEPVVVTALGRVIGWWTPLSRVERDASPSPSVESASQDSAGSAPEGREPDGSVAGTFNSKPFSPAPKVRKR